MSNSSTPTLSTSLFTDYDISLFRSGKHFRLYEKLGSRLMEVDGVTGVYFAVWAPNAREVSVIGDFNHWQGGQHPLYPRWDASGIWEGFIPDLQQGTLYKYHILAPDGRQLAKGDPFALFWETPQRYHLRRQRSELKSDIVHITVFWVDRRQRPNPSGPGRIAGGWPGTGMGRCPGPPERRCRDACRGALRWCRW